MNSNLYGLSAEFVDPEEILSAAGKVKEAGYRVVEAYTPFPVHGLAETIAPEDIRVPWMIFLAALTGTCAGAFLEWSTNSPLVESFLKKLPADVYTRQYAYPMNIGGKPYLSWPTFIPVAYETTILFAAGAAVVGMLALNGLPKPYHPAFNAPNFERASQDRFCLFIESSDPKFDYENTWQFLQSLNPASVSEVER